MTYGASPEEWAHFDLALGLADRLLPVVADPGAVISPGSKMRGLGKTPSWYNSARQVAGIPGWTQRGAPTSRELERWSAEPDYGICLRTGRLPGVGDDAPNLVAIDLDSEDADQVALAHGIAKQHLGDLPVRYRIGSERVLLLVQVDGETLYKRIARITGGERLEVLATGQQCVVAGTHTSGARYEWLGGLPSVIPTASAEAFEAFWTALNDAMAIEPPSAFGERRRGDRLDMADDRADWLDANWPNHGWSREGDMLFIDCPWRDGHSMDSGETETGYMIAGTQGYERGHYRCLHASCAGRSDDEFDAATGYKASDLVELPAAMDAGGKAPPPAAPGKRLLDPKDPMELARAFARSTFIADDGRKLLVRSGGLWFEHKGAAYEEVPGDAMKRRGWRFLDGCLKEGPRNAGPIRFSPNKGHVSEMTEALIAVGEYTEASPPAWLPGVIGPEPCDIVSLSDGLLHIPSRRLLPHTPGYFNLNALPYAWGAGEDAEPTGWLRFLDEIWPGDADAKGALQEVFGYLLTPDTSQQKMFMIVGPKRSGKGTIGRVLSGLIGTANLAAPTFAGLTGEFGLQPLIGKLVAMIADGRAPGGSAANQVVERLLTLSGEDAITVNRKNITMWTGQLAARVVILSNEVPRLGDASGALASRFITLATETSFYGREDIGLTRRLLRELPAIFRWALDGRDRLNARGHFVQPGSGREIAEEMARSGSPVAEFVADRCDLDPEAITTNDELFEAWRGWCALNGNPAGLKSVFVKSLHAAFPMVKGVRVSEDGNRPRGQAGLRVSALKSADLHDLA